MQLIKGSLTLKSTRKDTNWCQE